MLFLFSRLPGGFLHLLLYSSIRPVIGREERCSLTGKPLFRKKSMKIIVLTAICLALGVCELKAQGNSAPALAGTSWKGTANVPDPLTCVLRFTKDTIRLLYVDNSEIKISDGLGGSRVVTGKDSASLEAMTWRQSGDTIELQKVVGGSPCGWEKGRYRVQTAGGKLQFILIEDPCSARPYALREEMLQVK